MPCDFKPMQAYGASKASLLQRIGVGDVWAFLRDFVQNAMLRSEFYDGEGNFYHGLANTIGGEGTVSTYADDIKGYTGGAFGNTVTVNDYWQENPQSEEMVLAPGVTSFIRAMPRYNVATVGATWGGTDTHKEAVYKYYINGETWYGRMPLFSQNPDSATYLPNVGAGLGTTVTTFGQTTTALAGLHTAIVDLNNRLADQGVLRAIGDSEGPG